MFGRATITLGIGPHSSLSYFSSVVLVFAFSALTWLVGHQEGHLTRKKYGRMVEVGTGWSGTQPDGQCVCLC